MIAERALSCRHCGGKRFFERTVVMTDASASFLGFDRFGSRGAFCYVCSECGHVHWFLPKV